MKNFKKNLFFVYIVLTALILSCSSMSEREWNNLQDRNFYFQKFTLVKKGINDKIAFQMMKSFPVDKMLALLAHKYNITVDSSEYHDLILSEDAQEFKEQSIFNLLKSEYTWESTNKNPNSIEFTHYFLFDSLKVQEDVKYKIVIKVNDKVKETIYNDLYQNESTVEYLAKGIGYSRLNPKSDAIFVNNKTKAQIDLTKASFSQVTAVPAKTTDTAAGKPRTITENTIKQDIKQYINKMTPGNRKKFRDSIIKYLYSEIE
ncbi:MAG: hypothetical protein JXN64_03795 [Spirochaetes bacterium]|nr:hypothetical protein [Spirochaetota bacterium]